MVENSAQIDVDDDAEFSALQLAMDKSASVSEASFPSQATYEDRFERKAAQQESQQEEKPDLDAGRTSSKVWLEIPSVSEQLTRYPATVRLGGPVTVVFNLGDEKQLMAWNILQSKTAGDAPSVVISQCESNFYEGVYWLHATYKPLQYQKLT